MGKRSPFRWSAFLVLVSLAWARGGGIATLPVEHDRNTRVLWLEGDSVWPAWQGADVRRVVDEETGEVCLEWFQDPATKATAKLVLKGIDPERYDAVRLQWKHLGGGAGISVAVGQRNWYLFKDKYRPNVWRDAWLDLRLDDDRGGPHLNEQGELVVQLRFYNLPQNRSDEQSWRRVRVRGLRLVRFPVRLTCDPKRVEHHQDAKGLHTIFPMRLVNATARPQPVRLFLDPSPLRHFAAAFETTRLTAPPRGEATVRLTFSISAEAAATHDPLYIEEAPVYAVVEGDAQSLTTWYRAYVQWKPGGVVPPRRTRHPLLVPEGMREKVLERAKHHAWAKKALDKLCDATKALDRPLHVPELRHGYSGHNICPKCQKPLQFDMVRCRRHYCPHGKHHVEGAEHLDRAAALAVHTRNSNDCRTLGWAYYFTRDERYAKKAAELLLAYAARYPTWDYRNAAAVGYWSRVAHAVLGECWWIHGFVDGYDLVAASPSLTDAQRETIRRDFFALAAESIQSHRISKNQQCEVNWAAGGAAVNARCWYLAALRFTGAYGLRDQIELAFSEEGFSRENEFPYHYAALLPIVEQGVAYDALGARFFTPAVKRLFDAPLAFSIDQRLGWTRVYEVAYAHYRDPAYLRQLATARPGLTRLLHGVVPLPQQAAGGELTNSSLALAGKSVLRKGTVDALRAAQISWGASTWRGGKDFLNVLAHFRGVALNRSVSRIGYGYSIKGLSYDTLAGNLPQVDGLTQTGVRPRQVTIVHGDVPAAKYVAPVTAAMYPGVRLSRVVAIAGDTFAVLDRLASAEAHRYSFSFYPAADKLAFTGTGEFKPYPAFAGDGRAYSCVQSPTRARGVRRFAVDYAPAKKKRRLVARAHFVLDGEGEVVQGRTHTGWHPFLTPLVVARRKAKTAACVLVVEAGDKELPVTKLEVLPVEVNGKAVPAHDGLAVAVATKGGSYLVIDCDLPGTKKAGGVVTKECLWVGKMQ